MDNHLTLILGAAVGIILLIIAAKIFNDLIVLRNHVKKALSNIDVIAKQRHDEIPKLVDTCKEYMGYEQETLMQVMDARGSVFKALGDQNMGQFGKAETKLRTGLGSLFALAENYPDLKANQSFQQLQTRISALESTLSDRRETYNENVTMNNIRVSQFPDIVIAKSFGFNKFDLLEFSEAEIADVDVNSLFKK